ncbi:MAG: twin-arginine translocase TatA/TatE family subunit [Kofleriaceae bacterium]|nr:twin-arginine translocase TatA/TatE family subunit [Kofleriaceae bacterium]
MPGMGELIIILLIVLVIFGASKLPGIGAALGKSIRNFKQSSNGSADDEIEVKKTAALEGKAAKELKSGDGDSDFEEVVVRRRIKKDAS